MLSRQTKAKLQIVFSDSTKVAIWVFISAGLTGILSWALGRPEFFKYYGAINLVLYIIKELNDQFKKK